MKVKILSATCIAICVSTCVVDNVKAAERKWVTVMEDHFADADSFNWVPWLGDVPDESGKVIYTYKAENISVGSDALVLRGDVGSKPPYYQTGGIYSPRNFKYGRYSARVKMTNTPGVIPAFWLVSYHPACGEIDIFEATGLKASDPRKVNTQHYYFPDLSKCSGSTGIGAEWSADQDYSQGYHIFSAEWTSDYIAYSVDGVEKYRSTQRIPSVPMRVNLNTNLEPPTSGDPYIKNRINGNTVFPAEFLVDWVKVEQFAPRACTKRGSHSNNLRSPDGSCASVLSMDLNADGAGDVLLYNPQTGEAANATGQVSPNVGLVVHSLTNGSSQQAWASNAKMVSGDFDGDGFSDLLVYGGDGSVRVLYGGPDASLVERVNSRTVWNKGSMLFSGDFNGDGLADVLILQSDGNLEVRYGSRARELRFSPASQVVTPPGGHVSIGDFNGDGYDDLMLYSPSGEVHYFYGQSSDGFRKSSVRDLYRSGLSFFIGDFNGDGYSDVLIYGVDGFTEIRYGQSNDGMRFAQASQTRWNTGHSIQVGDYNGDGDDDVLIYGADGSVEVRYGQPNDGLRFSPQSKTSWTTGHHLMVNDYDGDGKSDVLIQSSDGSIEIRYGQASDGLRFAPATQTRWNLGWTLYNGGQ